MGSLRIIFDAVKNNAHEQCRWGRARIREQSARCWALKYGSLRFEKLQFELWKDCGGLIAAEILFEIVENVEMCCC
jgi:hypothetical protein